MLRATTGAEDVAAEDLLAIERFLHSIAGRLRLERTIRSTALSLLWSSAALLLLRTFAYALSFPDRIAVFSSAFAAIIFFVPAAVTLGTSLTKRYDLMLIARFTDERLGLKDRLATALSSRLSVMEPSFARHIARDAKDRIEKIGPQTVVPIRFSIWNWSVLAVLLVTGFALTAPQSPLSVNSRSYRQLMITTSRERNAGATNTLSIDEPVTKDSVGRRVSVSAQDGSRGNASPLAHSVNDSQKKNVLADAASEVVKLLSRLTGQSGQKVSTGGKTDAKGTGQEDKALSGSKSSNAPGAAGDTGQVPTLGNKLRQFAERLAQRPLTSGEQQDAANTVDSINHKLDELQMPKTQQKLTSATQELRDGQQNDAINDIRSAAYYADHEGAVMPPGEAQGAIGRNTVDIPARQDGSHGASNASKEQSSGQGSSSGTGSSSSQQSSGQRSSGQPNGSASAGRQTGGTAASGASKTDAGSGGLAGGHPQGGQSGTGYGGGAQKPRVGAPRLIDPSKLGSGQPESPITLPISNASGRSSEKQGTKDSDAVDGPSTVPYLPGHQAYKTTPEHAASSDDIPPAYRNLIRQYFSAPVATH
jgi:hypothetical protein